jgi:predicted nucleic acid-binding protein
LTYLLDTNAISEPGRTNPDPAYARWFGGLETSEIRLSAISVGELRRGVALLDPGERRGRVESLYANIIVRFSAQILPVDIAVAETWGSLSARLKRTGMVIGAPDELIAATALAHGLTLVTRNSRHFEPCGCDLLSPWSS